MLLIAAWCLGSVVMRLTDLSTAVMLDYPYSRYDTMTLAGFDLVTAVLAIWLRLNLKNDALPARLISSLSGFLFALSVSRVILGVVLAPRFATPRRAGEPGLWQQFGPADQQRLRRDAVRPGPGHSRRRPDRAAAAPTAANAATSATAPVRSAPHPTGRTTRAAVGGGDGPVPDAGGGP
ncbi:hypothetical protein NIIDMKKI_65530 [Mycobacterium kansasii]|uniref:DUF7937 domain-containing protein n=1 Tax=Mycobacterium kansasii TaxID=1768 RepID=A0A7G1IKP5_MYCKA|nr:hypothetical protein NIIDMKKI_65530 [Mycobacterium kansasii]